MKGMPNARLPLPKTRSLRTEPRAVARLASASSDAQNHAQHPVERAGIRHGIQMGGNDQPRPLPN